MDDYERHYQVAAMVLSGIEAGRSPSSKEMSASAEPAEALGAGR